MNRRKMLTAVMGGRPQNCILRDEFTSDVAAGDLHLTTASDGVSKRWVVDPGDSFSISGGNFVIAPTISSGAQDTNINWMPMTIIPSKIVIATLTPVANNPQRYPDFFGWRGAIGVNPPNSTMGALRFLGSAIYYYDPAGNGAISGSGNPHNISHQVAIIITSTGCSYWIKGGVYTAWTNVRNASFTPPSKVFVTSELFRGWTGIPTASIEFVRVYNWYGGTPDIYFNLPTTLRVNRVYKSIWFFGDSKTSATALYHELITTDSFSAFEVPALSSNPGWTITDAKNGIAAILAGYTTTPDNVCINLGINGAGAINEATFKADYQAVIDAIHTKWADAKIYLARIWARAVPAASSEANGWINTLISTNAGVCFPGHNEFIWMENGDDGVTYTDDGVHPNAAGNQRACDEWRASFGY